MTKTELVEKLNKIYNNLDSLPGDSSLKSAAKDIENINYDLGDIITDVEDNGIEIEDKEESDKE